MNEREQRIWDAAFATAALQFGGNANPELIAPFCKGMADTAVLTLRAVKRRNPYAGTGMDREVFE